MRFVPTTIEGVFTIELQRLTDERGYFARTWCEREFAEQGLTAQLAQCSISLNKLAGTLRGLHYQAAPHEECKTVRCTRGSAFDVVVDLRTASSTYLQWTACELTAENGRMIYIPKGCAHGFVTLEDSTEISYCISEFYQADSAFGVRWDDPALGIAWPIKPKVVSQRDASYPLISSESR